MTGEVTRLRVKVVACGGPLTQIAVALQFHSILPELLDYRRIVSLNKKNDPFSW